MTLSLSRSNSRRVVEEQNPLFRVTLSNEVPASLARNERRSRETLAFASICFTSARHSPSFTLSLSLSFPVACRLDRCSGCCDRSRSSRCLPLLSSSIRSDRLLPLIESSSAAAVDFDRLFACEQESFGGESAKIARKGETRGSKRGKHGQTSGQHVLLPITGATGVSVSGASLNQRVSHSHSLVKR